MHVCYAMQILETKKIKQNQRTMVTKGRANEAQGPCGQRQIKDTESHQSLDKESQIYFYQEVW